MVAHMEKQGSLNHEKEKTSKFEILKRASGNIDEKNLIKRYRAIRQISSLINSDDYLLDWLNNNHNGFLEDMTGKLRLVIKEETDGAMISEAALSIELIETHISTHEPIVSGNLVCKNCQGAVQPDWKHCPKCGQDLQQIYCTKCGNKLDSSWKICPRCGTRSIQAKIMAENYS
jgi:RNA polymerase subunit RPABC4/transcription elongation factor Spt4